MTKKEKELINVLEQMKDNIIDIIDYVESFNNMCASTDRKVESVIELSKKLELLYEGIVKDYE